jgi:hypothetical protein
LIIRIIDRRRAGDDPIEMSRRAEPFPRATPVENPVTVEAVRLMKLWDETSSTPFVPPVPVMVETLTFKV